MKEGGKNHLDNFYNRYELAMERERLAALRLEEDLKARKKE